MFSLLPLLPRFLIVSLRQRTDQRWPHALIGILERDQRCAEDGGVTDKDLVGLSLDAKSLLVFILRLLARR